MLGNFKAFHDYHIVRSKMQEIIFKVEDKKDVDVWGVAKKKSVLVLAEEVGPPRTVWFFPFYWTVGLIIMSSLWYIPYKRRMNE